MGGTKKEDVNKKDVKDEVVKEGVKSNKEEVKIPENKSEDKEKVINKTDQTVNKNESKKEVNVRTLDLSPEKDTEKNILDLKTYGDENTFKLLCKSCSEKEGFMKSTKVCNVEFGCIVQFSSQQRNPDGSYSLAESSTYIPSVHIDINSEPRKFIPIVRS